MSLLPVGQRGLLTSLNFDILTSIIIIVVSNVIYLVNSVCFFSKSSFYKILLLLKVIIQHFFSIHEAQKDLRSSKDLPSPSAQCFISFALLAFAAHNVIWTLGVFSKPVNILCPYIHLRQLGQLY